MPPKIEQALIDLIPFFDRPLVLKRWEKYKEDDGGAHFEAFFNEGEICERSLKICEIMDWALHAQNSLDYFREKRKEYAELQVVLKKALGQD